MTNRVRWVPLGLIGVVMCLPHAALAQNASIAGVVRDGTGAVLPGVTVEATSPVLIEKVREAVTDGQGQYKIVNLRPGVYTVTFTLSGFNATKREGIELSGSFTATVNADMRLGAIEETVTVSGQSPTIDVQNVVRERVVSREAIDAIPTGTRSFANLAVLIPGTSTATDVGGTTARNNAVTIHNTRPTETQILFDGMPTNHGGGVGGAQVGLNFNNGAVQEMSLQVGGLGAESELGGLTTNIIPREGANTFRGVIFANYTNGSLQSDNLSDDLKAQGLTSVNSVDKIWDINPGAGGPVLRDKLWFYVSGRSWGTHTFVANNYYNLTPNSLTYTPDLSRQATYPLTLGAYSGRMTWQASPRNKVAGYYTLERAIYEHYINQTLNTPEVTLQSDWAPDYMAQATWTSPMTNKLLFEGGATFVNFAYSTTLQSHLTLDIPSFREISTGYVWRNYQQDPTGNAPGTQAEFMGPGINAAKQLNVRFATSYVTGSHAAKFGVRVMTSSARATREVTGNAMTLQLLNGVPNRVTVYATPVGFEERLKANVGLFAQDQWTVARLTLNLGVRFDYLDAYVPAIHLAAGRFVPARDFPRVDDVPNWKDVSPRLGAAYDLFGNGRTAVKVSAGRYLGGGALLLFTRVASPVTGAVITATRTWNDANRDFTPQESELGPLSDSGFGGTRVLTRYDDSVSKGFGVRGDNWETSAGITHELFPGVSADVSYFRRWYGNFTATDNLAVGPGDFSPYCITAPADARLPGGGGYPVCGLYDVNPNKFGQSNNIITQASNFGKQREVFDGVDVTLSARLAGGLVASGGTATGRTVLDTCFTIDSPQQLLNCEVAPPFRTQIKGYVVYPLPWWGLQTSASFQSIPGPQITASYAAPNAIIAPSLGRNLGSCGTAVVCNATATVPLIAPGTLFGERMNQIDYRLTKSFTIGGNRLQAMLDLFNVFNVSPVLTQNNTFGPSWQRPQSILQGRLVKFGMQMDF